VSELGWLSELLQQSVHSLQISCDSENYSQDICDRNLFIAKNYAEQALQQLIKIMGTDFQNYYTSPLV
jgi:hypothetical protein